jgi:hypothetical protein
LGNVWGQEGAERKGAELPNHRQDRESGRERFIQLWNQKLKHPLLKTNNTVIKYKIPSLKVFTSWE